MNRALGLALVLLAACSKKQHGPDEASAVALSATPPATEISASAGPAAEPTAAASEVNVNCRGTMSGAANGPLTCYSIGLFFLPSYRDPIVRGNTQITVMSSAQLRRGVPPPGVQTVSWAGVFRGELKPGTYTEKDLVPSKFDVAGVSIAGQRYLAGLKRVRLVVKSVSTEGVREDVMTKNGPTRTDRISGDVEIAIGDASRETVVRATLN
jgi:hypothetical protein